MQPATRNFAALFCGCLLFNLAGTWLLPLVDRDEPRFAEASREMIERHDYVVPYFNDRYRFDKPPLTYWAQIASFRLFGETDFAARFPSAVAGALTAIVIFAWGCRLNLSRAGFWAAIVFTLSPQSFIHAKAAVADMWLVLFMTLAHWAGYELLRDRFGGTWRSVVLQPKGLRGWWWAFYISLALAFLAKGPIGWMPLATVLITQRCRPVSYFRRRFLFVRGMLFVLAIIAIWGVPALLRTHGEFFAIGFGRHVVGRSFGTMQGHGGNALGALAWLPFYFVTVFASFAPWSIKIPWLTRRLWKERDTLDLYLIAGVAMVFGIFTIVQTKLPHYVLPAFPLLALLLVRHWLQSEADGRTMRRWSVVTAILMIVVAFVGSRLVAPYFPATALFKQAEPYLQSEMDFAAYQYDAASLVWSFRSRVRGFLHYNRKNNRDTATLQPDQIPSFLASPGPHFAVLPTDVATRLYPSLPSGYRKFSVRGIDIAKVGIRFDPAKWKIQWKGWVNLTLILKNT